MAMGGDLRKALRGGGTVGQNQKMSQTTPPGPTAAPPARTHRSPVLPVALDDVNRAIVKLLQEDGRRSFADIAKRVSRSEASVRQRVARLMRAGVIQIVAVTDQLQMGYARTAMIAIRVDGDVDAAAEQIAEIEEVDYLVATAGGVDLFAEVVAVDDENLYHVVTRIRAVPGVRHAESYVYFKLYKQTYEWGAR